MFSHPKKNSDQMFIGEGMHVADFGSGTGSLTIHLAEKVGPHGKIFAIDFYEDHLLKLKNEAKRHGLENIHIIKSDLETENGSGLKAHSVDRVVISNILFHLENREVIAKEALRIIKPRGKVVVIDWEDSFGHIGPHPDHVFKKGQALILFKRYGFELEKEIDAGSHHYGLLFKLG